MDIAQLGISVDSRQVKTATGDLDRLAGASGKAEKATSGVTSATQAFGGALASLGIAAATSQLVKMADTYGLLQSKIGLATGEITKAAEATDMVFAAAQRARVGLDELGSMVARLAPSIRDMGGTTQDAVAASELFAKTLKISGATAEESASAILQFGQALGTGRLGGEEFNAVNESSGRYMQLLAKELGVTRGELKKMAEDGKLTGDVLINALANNATTLEGEFQQLRVTGAETFGQLKNSTMLASFELDKASGVSQEFNGVMNAGRGIIDAVTLALRDTNSTASDTSIIVPTVTKVFQTLGIVAAETVYVFKETGRTLGALAAQAAALAQGDLDLYKRIGEERDRDSTAARAAVDKLTASIANSETATAKLATTAPKLSTGLKAVKTSTDDNSKALKAAQRIAEQAADAYGDLERSLRKQLLTEEDLTTAQKVSMDLTDKRYKHLSDKQKANLVALAKEVDAFKAQEKLFKDMAASAQELADSDTKRQQAAADSAYQSRKAVEDQLAKLQEEADTYGMTEAEIQRYLLAKAEEKLALEQGGEARQGVIDQLQAEIEARKQLTTATGAAETKKATEALGGAVQGTIADAIKAGLNAPNPIKGFAQSLGNAVKNALYNAVAQGLATSIASVVGFGGASGGAMASGGGSDIFSLGSSAKSMYDIISGASVGNAASGALQSFSTSSMGQYFGLSDAAGNLTQAGADLTVQVGNFADAASQYGGYAKAAYDVFNAFKEGKGWGAAAGSAIGSIWGAPGAFIGNKIGGLVDSAFSGGGGQKFGGEGAIGRANAGLFPEGQTDAQVQAALQTFSTGLTDVAKRFGGTLNNLGFAYGYETDPQGDAGNFFSSVLEVNGEILRNVQVQKFSGEVSDQMASEFKTATVLALKAANLSADLQTAFDGFDPAIEGAADKVLARLEEIKAVADAFDSLGKAMPQLSGLSLQARESLIQLAGGAEALASGVSTYYDAFYSETEKTTRATEQLSAQMSALGLSLPETKDGFRALVEAQDLTTESGRKTYTALLGMSGAFASVADAAAQAAEAAEKAAAAAKAAAIDAVQLALGALQSSVAAEKENLSKSSAEIIAGYQAQIDAAKESAAATISEARDKISVIRAESQERAKSAKSQISALNQQASQAKKSYAEQVASLKTATDAAKKAAKAQEDAQKDVLDAISSRVDELQSIVDMLSSGIADSVEMDFDRATKYLADAIEAGGVYDKDQLKAAIDAINAIDEGNYSTSQELERAKALATSDMSRLQRIVNNQLDVATDEKEIAEKQLSAIELVSSTIEAEFDASMALYERLASEAQASYDSQIAAIENAASMADADAEQQISALEQLIDGTSSGLDGVVEELSKMIEQEQSSLSRQLEQLDKLYQSQEKAVNELLGIKDATLSVNDAIEELGDAIKSFIKPGYSSGSGAASSDAVYTGAGSAPTGTTSIYEALNKIYKDVLKREADVAGLNFYAQQAMGGKSLEQIRAEIANSPEAKGINGSHRNGLAEVPFDGYRAELHAGERVLTAQQADSSDKMAVDIAEMRREMAAAMQAIADATRRTARLQERWDGDGLPDPRGY